MYEKEYLISSLVKTVEQKSCRILFAAHNRIKCPDVQLPNIHINKGYPDHVNHELLCATNKAGQLKHNLLE